jgi:hypothetical protein
MADGEGRLQRLHRDEGVVADVVKLLDSARLGVGDEGYLESVLIPRAAEREINRGRRRSRGWDAREAETKPRWGSGGLVEVMEGQIGRASCRERVS